MQNFIMNVPQTLILFKIASVILSVQKYLEGAVIETIITIFCIEIHLLKDDSRYHENKWHSLVQILTTYA